MSTTTREKPILMSGPMVRAILEGRKTQTRRVVKFPRFAVAECVEPLEGYPGEWTWFHEGDRKASIECPYGAPGDTLWCKETWAQAYEGEGALGGRPIYRADGGAEAEKIDAMSRWRSPRYMPRWASRLTLRVTAVRVERLQEISEADIYAEGVGHGRVSPMLEWQEGWDTINGKRAPWASNPWVWVVSFERVEVE